MNRFINLKKKPESIYDSERPIAKSEAHFKKWLGAYPFYTNVQKEGVELYGTAG